MVPRNFTEFTAADIALFSSYSLGMVNTRIDACPTLNGRDPLNTYVNVKGTEPVVLEVALDDPVISETCYWIIRPERDILIPETSSLTLTIDSIQNGYLYMFEGTSRSNTTTSLIENGQPYVIGAPIRTTINNDIVVVFQKSSSYLIDTSSFKMTIEMAGREYPFWEKPFVGVNETFYYLAVIGIPAVVVLTILICLCCCVKCCCRGTCCCCFKCCNCAKKQDNSI